jgi:hypothetical protein
LHEETGKLAAQNHLWKVSLGGGGGG